uniref:KOW domain-containing protein n=1 Tax=Rhabditophanes sp. KR3021 TaxID=114890 RepID=A0AC35TZ62_9BILA
MGMQLSQAGKGLQPNALTGKLTVNISKYISFLVRSNSNRASITNVGRTNYIKGYLVEVMRGDGSVVMARCNQPYHVAQLPLDLKSLSDEERRQRLAARKPKSKKVVGEEIDDGFNVDEYSKFWDDSKSRDKL